MVYKPHHLLSFGGHQGHIEEIWACGIRLAEFGTGDPTDSVDHEQYLTDTALPALAAWFARSDSKIYINARIKWVKFNAIRPDGRYEDQTTTHERAVDFPGGSSGTNGHPYQCCVVLSWRTDAAQRGPGSKGRIYSPRPMLTLDANTADIAGADRVLIANSAALLLNSLDVGIGSVGGAVLRPVIASAVGEGVNNQIDLVVVDSAIDIQRRRANSQSREVTSAPVLY